MTTDMKPTLERKKKPTWREEREKRETENPAKCTKLPAGNQCVDLLFDGLIIESGE